MVYVDLPDIDGHWKNVATLGTKSEAVAWIRANVGHCDDEGNVSLISEIEPDDNPVQETRLRKPMDGPIEL